MDNFKTNLYILDVLLKLKLKEKSNGQALYDNIEMQIYVEFHRPKKKKNVFEQLMSNMKQFWLLRKKFLDKTK